MTPGSFIKEILCNKIINNLILCNLMQVILLNSTDIFSYHQLDKVNLIQYTVHSFNNYWLETHFIYQLNCYLLTFISLKINDNDDTEMKNEIL